MRKLENIFIPNWNKSFHFCSFGIGIGLTDLIHIRMVFTLMAIVVMLVVVVIVVMNPTMVLIIVMVVVVVFISW
jgi:hypothetical protein